MDAARLNLVFGTFTGSRIDSTGNITLTCNGNGNNNPYAVALSQGVSNSFIDRFMHQGGGGVGGEMAYNMYIDPSRTTIWGNGLGPKPASTSDRSISGISAGRHPCRYSIYGRIRAQPVPRAGRYNDSIIVTAMTF